MELKLILKKREDISKSDDVEVSLNNKLRKLIEMYPEDLKNCRLTEQPVAANSVASIFFDQNSLPFPGATLKDLYGIPITYAIYLLLDGKDVFPYIGCTDDIGERAIDHVKDARDSKTKIYEQFRQSSVGIMRIISISDSIEKARWKERELIKECKNASFEAEIPEPVRGYVDREEKKLAEQKHVLNINN